MKWFSKRKQKRDERSNQLGHELFGDIWDNEKARDGLILFFWALFMIAVFLIVKNGKNTTNSKIEPNTPNYPLIETYFEQFNNNTYKYNINIYDNDTGSFTTYNGDVSDGVDIGVKEVNNDVINYTIKDGVITVSLNNNVITNLYDDYLNYYFRMNNIYSYIKDIQPSISYEDNSKVYLYNGKYLDKDINFTIKTNLSKITYLEYNYNNCKYILNLTCE